MPAKKGRDDSGTNPSIFLRLNATDGAPREIAWAEFERRYRPMIAGFARRVGAGGADVDDVVQDVMLGFFSLAPTFAYDPSKGRFRRYLKICTYNAVCKRFGKRAKLKAVPLSTIDEEAIEVEQVWTDVWEKERLDTAMQFVRDAHAGDRSWQAFELTVVKGRAAQEVAAELGVTVSTVYKSRDRIGEELRAQLTRLEQEEG